MRRLRLLGEKVVNAGIRPARLLSHRERVRHPPQVKKADLMARFADEPAEPRLQPEGGNISKWKKYA